MNLTIQKIRNWAKNYLTVSGTQGFVVGISGGIDSAVVTALLSEVTDNFFGLILPCNSNKEDAEDALLVAKHFNIKYEIVDLSETYNKILSIFPESDNLNKSNIKPRLRMTTLYYFAGKYNYLVSGTDNKSELYTGYFTKFGDGGIDILPIADLYKFQIKQLAKELNVPDKIVRRKPTAGLWSNQTDEDELGISYDTLDKILQTLIDKKDISLTEYELSKVEYVKSLIKKSEHKRNLAPICLLNT